MELLAELSQENLIELLHEIKGRKVPDALVARICGVSPQVIPRWREGTSLPRNFDRVYLTLRGLSAVTQGHRLTAPAATAEPLSTEPSTDEDPWKEWREFFQDDN